MFPVPVGISIRSSEASLEPLTDELAAALSGRTEEFGAVLVKNGSIGGQWSRPWGNSMDRIEPGGRSKDGC